MLSSIIAFNLLILYAVFSVIYARTTKTHTGRTAAIGMIASFSALFAIATPCLT